MLKLMLKSSLLSILVILLPIMKQLLLLLLLPFVAEVGSNSWSTTANAAAFVAKDNKSHFGSIHHHRRRRRGRVGGGKIIGSRRGNYHDLSSSSSSSSSMTRLLMMASSLADDDEQHEYQKYNKNIVGTYYRPIADMVWEMLLDTKWVEECDIDPLYQSNVAPSRGMDGYVVRMETRALQQKSSSSSSSSEEESPPPPPFSYARMALLETIPNVITPTTTAEADASSADDDDDENDGSNKNICTSGIQVLNLVLFPSKQTTLPVWGADFVSLPGNKHLLLLDAQPMNNDTSCEHKWMDWYETNSIPSQFVWGGDMPDAVQPFISKYALWTRWGGGADNDTDETGETIPSRIQGPLTDAVQKHLEVYLQLLREYHATDDDDYDDDGIMIDNQKDYIQYRLENDPARPMLKSLYGEEWTENVLSEVLFPQQ